MISTETSVKLKRGLGHSYLETIKKEVEAKGAVTRNGTPYTKNYISAVLEGEREIPVVEETIWEVYSRNVMQVLKDARTMGVPIPEAEVET
jgi:hypothetical protein